MSNSKLLSGFKQWRGKIRSTGGWIQGTDYSGGKLGGKNSYRNPSES